MAKDSKFNDNTGRFLVRAIGRVFLFLCPTTEMLRACTDLCKTQGFEFAPGLMYFVAANPRTKSAGTYEEQGEMPVDYTLYNLTLSRTLEAFVGRPGLLNYALFGTMHPGVWRSTLDDAAQVGRFFKHLDENAREFLIPVCFDRAASSPTTNQIILKLKTKHDQGLPDIYANSDDRENWTQTYASLAQIKSELSGGIGRLTSQRVKTYPKVRELGDFLERNQSSYGSWEDFLNGEISRFRDLIDAFPDEAREEARPLDFELPASVREKIESTYEGLGCDQLAWALAGGDCWDDLPPAEAFWSGVRGQTTKSAG